MTQEMEIRALRNIRIQGPSSPQDCGCQEFCVVRATRSGCGIIMVARPSSLLSPQMPPAEPFGFAGYFLATLP